MNAPAIAPVIPDVVELLREAHAKLLRSRIKVAPAHAVRASSVGKECARELFYEQTAHEHRAMYEPELQAIFDLGNELEGYVVRLLEDMGFVVEQRNRAFHDRQHNITGHLDGRLTHRSWEGKSYPIEIKGLNPYTADSITTLEDIRDSRQAWVRKYYAQLQIYEHLDGDELGIFVLLNKSSGWPEFIGSPIDRPFIEQLLARADVVKEAVLKGEPPERHRTPECRRCPFVHVCLPDIDFGPGVQVVDEPELIEAIRRREALRDSKRDYDAADRAVKALLPKQAAELLVGPYAVVGTEQHRKAHQVKASTFVKWDVTEVASGEQLSKREQPIGPARPDLLEQLKGSLEVLKKSNPETKKESSDEW